MKIPEIKIPKVRTPRLKTPKINAPKVQTPAFLNNLYRDMRDRRLLLPALALVIAVIAVPAALSSSSATTAPPPAPAAAGSAHEAATSPAVLTEQLGVTDYRKRLEQIKSKNPFRKHFTSAAEERQAGNRPHRGNLVDGDDDDHGHRLVLRDSLRHLDRAGHGGLDHPRPARRRPPLPHLGPRTKRRSRPPS